MALSQRESARQARGKIEQKAVFRLGHIFSRLEDDYYVVYSYGYHYPMFVYHKLTDTWYENTTKYSHTTTCHKNSARPDNVILLGRTTRQIMDILEGK